MPLSADHLVLSGQEGGVLHRLAKDVGLRRGDIHGALYFQLLVNQLVQGRVAHALIGAVHRLPGLDISALLNLCYAQLDREPGFTGSGHAGREGFWPAFHAVNWSRLFERADQEALRLFKLCGDYWAGRLDESGFLKMLPQKPCN